MDASNSGNVSGAKSKYSYGEQPKDNGPQVRLEAPMASGGTVAARTHTVTDYRTGLKSRRVHNTRQLYPRDSEQWSKSVREYIGMQLKDLRLRRGKTQSQVAGLLGVPDHTISGVERGQKTNRLIYRQVAAMLGRDLDELMPPDYYKRPTARALQDHQAPVKDSPLGETTPMEQTLVETFRLLTPADKRQLLSLAFEMVRDEIAKGEDEKDALETPEQWGPQNANVDTVRNPDWHTGQWSAKGYTHDQQQQPQH